MNNNFPVYLIGFTVFVIFGFRGLIVFLIGYFIYTKIIEPQLGNKKSGGLDGAFEDFFKNMFEEQSTVREVKSKKNNIPSFKFSNMELLTPKRVAWGLGIFVTVMILLDGLVSVPAGHVAVILDRGRGVLEESLPTGLHLKVPFWQTATIMDTRLQTYTMSIAPSEGELYGNDAIEALTKDGQQVKVDVTVQFFLSPTQASTIYSNVGLNYVDKIVRPAARSVIRNVVTGFNSKELFENESRQIAQTAMVEGMKANLSEKNIQLDDVLLRNVQFSTTYLQAIEDKQVAEQKIQKAEFERQEAEIQKEKKIIEASAEAEAIKLKGDALRRSPEVIELEMVQKLSPNISWGVLPDGVLPLLDLKDK